MTAVANQFGQWTTGQYTRFAGGNELASNSVGRDADERIRVPDWSTAWAASRLVEQPEYIPPVVVTRYINSGSTAGGDGTTNATAGANRAFVSWAAMEAATYAGSGTSYRLTNWPDRNETLYVYIAGTAAFGVIVAGTWTTDVLRRVYLIGDQPNALQYSTAHARIEATTASQMLRSNGLRHWTIRNLHWWHIVPAAATGVASRWFALSGGIGTPDIVQENCMGRATIPDANTSGVNGFWGDIPSGGRITDVNCVAYNYKGASGTHRGFQQPSAGNDHACVACEAIDCVVGFDSAGSASTGLLVKNCGTRGCGDGYSGTFLTGSTNNASDLAADAPGTNAWNSVTPTFVDYAGVDFHLDAADTAWRGFGADLSDDSRYPFATDGDGEARVVPWDIGADQAAALALAAEPSPAVTTWAAQTPTVASAVALTPSPGVTTWAAQTPTVAVAVTVTPSPALASWVANDAAVTTGGVAATGDTAVAVFTVPAPSTAHGGVLGEPAAAVAAWVAPTPVVAAAVTATPAPSVATWTAPTADALAGGVTALPSPAIAQWVANDASVAVEDATVFPLPAVAQFTVPSASVVIGSTTAAPDPAIAQWSALTPATTQGATTATPSPAVAQWVALDAAVEAPTSGLPLPAVATWAGKDASVSVGSVTALPSPAIAQWVASDATVETADPVVTAAPAVAEWFVPSASVVVSGVDVTPLPAVSRWDILDAAFREGVVTEPGTPSVGAVGGGGGGSSRGTRTRVTRVVDTERVQELESQVTALERVLQEQRRQSEDAVRVAGGEMTASEQALAAADTRTAEIRQSLASALARARDEGFTEAVELLDRGADDEANEITTTTPAPLTRTEITRLAAALGLKHTDDDLLAVMVAAVEALT